MPDQKKRRNKRRRTGVRSGALNVYRKSGPREQLRDVLKAMKQADVLSLSEVNDNGLLELLRDEGFGVVGGRGDTAIVFNRDKVELLQNGDERLNELEGPTPGMRSRYAAYALFWDKDDQQHFWQISAHTTPPRQGPKALRRKIRRQQYNSIERLARRLNSRGDAPVMLAGDLNFRNPNIAGFTNGAGRGIMKVMALEGGKVTDRSRIGNPNLNSDHAAVFATFGGAGRELADMPDGKKHKRGGRGKGPKRDRLDPAEIQREYGFAFQFFKSDPELWELLNKATKNNWGVRRFQAELQSTKWFRKHNDVWRQMTALKFSDPKTYRERLQNMRDQIQNLAGQWGAQLTPKELGKYSERALMMGWSSDQILDHIAKEIRPDKQFGYTGQLAGIEDQLQEVAFANGVRIGKKQLNKWMRQIVKGNADPAQFEDYVRGIAAQTFGAYGKEIKADMDAREVAMPYMQSMSDILEINPGSINMFDPTIRKALSYRNDKGEFVPMSLTDFEDSLRSDKRWQYTDNAREQLNGYAVALGQMFGVLA